MTNRPPGSVRKVTVTGLDVQSTGQIVVAGSLEYAPLASEPKDGRDAFVARLFDDGAFDDTFEPATSDPSVTFEGGYLLLDRGSDGDRVLSLDVDPSTDEITWLTHQLQYEHSDEEALLWRISFATPGGVVEAPTLAGTRDLVLVPRLDRDPGKLLFSSYGSLPQVCSIAPPAPRTCQSLEAAFSDRGLTASLAFGVEYGGEDGGYYWGVTATGGVGLAKFDRDFNPSTTFAAGVGYVLATPTAAGAGSTYRLTAVAAEGQGGVFVAGYTVASPVKRTPFLLKFHRDGSGLDMSFGHQGRVVGAAGPLVGWPCLLVDDRGDLWSAGLDARGPLVVRWAPDGTPETTLHDPAWRFTPERCALDAAERLLVAGGGRGDDGYAALKVLRILKAR
ncbi:MAG TPA: hypothetical protein VFS43_26490 [Polyangiaceae bacterium]|nr:hypothetical protein [Polyangiaceae bacterium]